MRRCLIACGLLLLCASSGWAQTALNPNTVEFTASADHNTKAVDGVTPLLDHYDWLVVQSSPTGALFLTVNLGKPTPDANNTIRVQPSFATLVIGTTYYAFVDAVGSANFGSARSAVSNPFALQNAPRPPGAPVVSQK
jgi:hypothetical protein